MYHNTNYVASELANNSCKAQNTKSRATRANGDTSAARSDVALITAVAAGDRGSMDLLYKRYSVLVYRYILKIVKNSHLAEDLTSDVFLLVWRKASQFENRAQLSTWILAIARWKTLATLRHSASRLTDLMDMTDRTRSGVLDIYSVVDGSGDPEDHLMEKEARTQMRSHVLQLSSDHQKIIDLLYYEERTVDEIAAITKASKNTVKTRAYYARQRLARLLSAGGPMSRVSPVHMAARDCTRAGGRPLEVAIRC